MFAIYFSRFQKHHFSLDEYETQISLNKMNMSSRFERKNQSIKEKENTKNKVRKSVKKSLKNSS
jgi:hypothetical protein